MRKSQDIILIWPEHTLGSVITLLFLVLLCALFIYMGFRLMHEGDQKKKDDWLKIYNWAIKRKLNSEEISILEVFFNSHKSSFRKEIIENKKIFRDALISFLIFAQVSAKHKVKLLGKCFPEIEARSEINSIEDLQSGEFAMIEQGQHAFFTRIILKEDSQLKLRCSDKDISLLEKDGYANLYIYRHEVGGYNFPCSVQEISHRALNIELTGKFQFVGALHLMAEIDAGLEISPYPEIFFKQKLMNDASLKGESPPSADLIFHGETTKISDRALMFRIKFRGYPEESPLLKKLKHSVDVDGTLLVDEALFHRQEFWNLKLILPGGILFESRGHIIPDKSHKGFLLFRYEKLEKKSLDILVEVIKKAGAVQEKLN